MQSRDRLLKLIYVFHKYAIGNLGISSRDPVFERDPNFTGISDESDPFPAKADVPSIEDKAKSFKYLQRQPAPPNLSSVMFELTNNLIPINNKMYFQIIELTENNKKLAKGKKEFYINFLIFIKDINVLIKDINVSAKLAVSNDEINIKKSQTYIIELNKIIKSIDSIIEYIGENTDGILPTVSSVDNFNNLISGLYNLRSLLYNSIETLPRLPANEISPFINKDKEDKKIQTQEYKDYILNNKGK